jgi:dTDP-4-amino-4,6-dideoxygalactose transaminase
MNSRLDELHAAILAVRLRHLDAELRRRRGIARRYDTGLATSVATPQVRPASVHAYHLYVVRTPARDALARALKDIGIGTNVHYPVPVHLQPAYAGRVALGPGGLPLTERICGEILSLPLHPFMTDEDVERVIAAVVRHAGQC